MSGLAADRSDREDSQRVRDVAESVGVSERTARKWLTRYRVEGPDGLIDRSSAPNVVANRTDEQTMEAIAALRRLTISRCRDGKIVEEWEVSDVFGLLQQIGALPEMVES